MEVKIDNLEDMRALMCDNALPVKTVSEQIQEIVEDICQHYCKYPDIWDEEAEGIELAESDHCMNCPLNRL